jgi:MFS family permease
MVIDSLGTGLFVPLSIVYFLHTTTLGLAVIGGSLSAGGLLSLPSFFVVGPMIDRFGAQRLVAAGNLLGAAGLIAYLFLNSAWELVAAALAASAGLALVSTATRALVSTIARSSDERAAWFALQNRVRNLGYGLGGLLGVVAVTTAGRWGYVMIAAGDAASYAVAATLVLRWQAPVPISTDRRPSTEDTSGSPLRSTPGTYRELLRDRPYLVLTSVNLMFVLCSYLPVVLLAVYITKVLHAPLWLTGASFTLNCLLVASIQGIVTGHTNHHTPAKVLALAGACFAVAFTILWTVADAPRWLIEPALFGAIGTFTFAEMLAGPVLNTLALSMAPNTRHGRYLATFAFSWALGGALAPGLLASLLALSAALPWLVLIAACALAVCGLRFLPAAHLQPQRNAPLTVPSVLRESR